MDVSCNLGDDDTRLDLCVVLLLLEYGDTLFSRFHIPPAGQGHLPEAELRGQTLSFFLCHTKISSHSLKLMTGLDVTVTHVCTAVSVQSCPCTV